MADFKKRMKQYSSQRFKLGLTVLAMSMLSILGTWNSAFAQTGTVSALDPIPEAVGSDDESANAPQAVPEIVDESVAAQTPPVLPDTTNTAPVPPQTELKAEEPANTPLTPLPQADQSDVAGTNVMGDAGVDQKHSGTYYDSTALVPDSELEAAGVIGPRKVDPVYEPGSSFVVVERGAKAGSYEAQYVAGTRALKLERFAAAMEIFEKLYKRNHNDPRVLMGLAIAQQGAGFSESAARTYEELLEVQPNNPDAIVNLMGLLRGQYPSVTLRKLSELRDRFPSNAGIPAQMALISAEGGEYHEAMKYFEVAASMEPSNPSHIYNMAIVLDKKGDARGAIKFYERALLMDASYRSNESTLPRDQIYDRLVVLRRKI